jgi:hypothetical protein
LASTLRARRSQRASHVKFLDMAFPDCGHFSVCLFSG